MNEDFLQFIWQNRLLKNKALHTVQGDELLIIFPGYLNVNQGPDFLEARIKIGDTEWAGNIEVHLKTSDFYKHKHHLDNAYSSLILHVVLENDLASGNLPVLELKSFLNKNLQTAYYKLFENRYYLPCHDFVREIDSSIKAITLQQKAIERLEEKCKRIETELIKQQNSWEAVFWQQLFKYAGGTTNTYPFEELAKRLDWNFLAKQTHQPRVIEAIMFGMAGFLNQNNSEPYYAELKKIFSAYRERLVFPPLDTEVWRFMRMRPNAFPTIRISQLANLVCMQPVLFSQILNSDISIKKLTDLLSAQASEFWSSHYTFKNIKPTKHSLVKEIGQAQKNSWMINVVAPVLFAYGQLKGIDKLKDNALTILEQLPPENNKHTRQYASYGFKFLNAADTQGVLQLNKNYCNKKQCLKCAIGTKILRNFVN